MSAPLHVPAETGPHAACWMAWPYREDEWVDLAGARAEIAAFARAIAETEPVELLVAPGVQAPALGEGVRVRRMAYGDAWTRDTGAIFGWRDEEPVALVFRFDGWGGKYRMAGDEDLAERIAAALDVRVERHALVLEGGGVELDGAGALMTTRDCLERRNPGVDVTARLEAAFGVERVIWLEGQLENDHTDGHIDTLARFLRPGEAVAMAPVDGDPNGETLRRLLGQLEAAGLKVHALPSPGAVVGAEGTLLPASYCNYYLANGQVLVPTYGVDADAEAVEALAALYPERRVRGLGARKILEGGGAFHCITRQQPARP